ncbi:SDR family NAD(P)-dependent oxidoreductase [Streptomyces sulphureus]|uniref:SDR family NAD(P)-dependent oxidoreductase n=1 Tax=Streptomyces sulphureus TaxID=47758 RepID=UPI00035DC620|nr:glucose 1-dehydrogenase [Streptomyces sulphureus]
MSITDYRTEFDGKTALITGAASGIGLAITRRLAAGGAAVVLADYNEEGAADAAAELQNSGTRAASVFVDVTDAASTSAAVRFAADAFGGLNLAVNNAGVAGPSQPTGAYDTDAWSQVIAVNLTGVFHSLRFELPILADEGGGAVVNLSSVLGVNGFAGSPACVAANHGVIGLTKTAALEYAPQGVRVNALGPGFVDTPLLGRIDLTEREELISRHPQGRLGTPEEMAEVAAFLLSDRASFVEGSFHLVDGGYSAQ